MNVVHTCKGCGASLESESEVLRLVPRPPAEPPEWGYAHVGHERTARGWQSTGTRGRLIDLERERNPNLNLGGT